MLRVRLNHRIITREMKVLLVFRGGYSKIDPVLLCKNIHDKVFTPLTENGIEYSTLLYTYPTEVEKLNALKQGLNASEVNYTQEGQIINFKEAVKDITTRHSMYDFTIFLRFEIIYKLDIMKWNIFTQSGVIFPFKENCITLFTQTKQYSDIIIAVSKEYMKSFSSVLDQAHISEYTNTNTLHNLGTIINRYDYEIPVLVMLEGFYQSNTSLEADDERLNPMFIMSHYIYNGRDRNEFSAYLPTDQHTYPSSYQPRYTQMGQRPPIINNYPTEGIELDKGIVVQKSPPSYTAVIIETRKHKALEFVLRSFLTTIDASFLVFCGNLNKEFCEDLLDGPLLEFKPRVRIVHMNVDTMTPSEYSVLLSTTKIIYNEIPTEHFLIFQTDTMLFPRYKDHINEFFQYDYVGAPWNNDRFGGVGNGGLSLRRKSKMLEIIDNVTYYGEPEDVYFCNSLLVHLHRPTMEQAKRFSVEEVFHPHSFGCHRPWERGFDKQLLTAYPEVRTLFELNGKVPQA